VPVLATDVTEGEGEGDRKPAAAAAAGEAARGAPKVGWGSTGGVQVGPPVEASDEWNDETDSDEAMPAEAARTDEKAAMG
jgi:hypothetical protein